MLSALGIDMLSFDSPEYWQRKTWDRYAQLEAVPLRVQKEFLAQEHLTVCAVRQFKTKEGRKVSLLDLACGTGRIAESILDACGDEVYATLVDFNPRTLALAKEHLTRFPAVNFEELDVYTIGTAFPRHTT